ncbi:RsiV family protein, partial [Mycobacterium intracellulare]
PPANPAQTPPANQPQTTPPANQTPTAPPVAIAPAAAYDPANYQNFAVTNDGVIFFFDQGRMVPDATQVLVPRSAIDPMLA